MNSKEQGAYEEALHRIEECQHNGSEILDLSTLGLTRLPPEIAELTALEVLELSSNQLSSLPTEIDHLAALTSLNISSNRLGALPLEVCRLTSLTFLVVSDNELSALPPEIGQLTSLTNLYVSSNQLRELPPEIGRLTALRELSLVYNQLSTLPPEIGRLTALKGLRVYKNQLSILPPEIGRLTALEQLDLSSNSLSTLPPEIGNLSELVELELTSNQLVDLPQSLLTLSNLGVLFLHENEALRIPIELLGPTWSECYQERKSDSPQRKPSATPHDILRYFFSIRGGKGRPLREVKLVLVGLGEVGKSTMADVLRGNPFVEKRARTDGIAITPWVVELEDGPAKIMIWDFGGQEITHGTHQFFLTKRCVYFVMVDGRHDRAKPDAEYWLKLARVFGGESPIFLVMNRQADHPFDLDRRYFAKKYGVKLDHFFRTSCEKPEDVASVRDALLQEVGRLLRSREDFPMESWALKEHLEAMKERRENYLSEREFAELGTRLGLHDPQVLRQTLDDLVDLGTVVSFPEELTLSDFMVLNPEWATDGIYRVMTDESLREKRQGVLRLEELRALLPRDRWPQDKHVCYVRDLMEKFELCFPLPDEKGAALVPQLLPDQTPALDGWAPERCVVFRYDYTVLPHGVLPRFITRTHKLEGGLRWRSGVVLAKDGASALVRADYDENRITVWVRGEHRPDRRALLHLVRNEFDAIHKRVEGLSPTEMVAVPGHPEVLVPYRDLILDDRARNEFIRVTINGERKDWSVEDLLSGVASSDEREREKRRLDMAHGARNIHLEKGAIYNERQEFMDQSQTTNVGRDLNNQGGQFGHTLKNCTTMIQQQAAGEQRELLEQLAAQVKALIEKLPDEKKDETAKDLERAIEGASGKNRRWYSVSAEGLLEATKFLGDFGKEIGTTLGTTLGKLGKAVWPDFTLPAN